MNRRKFRSNKLWRDKAIDLLEEMGSKIHWQTLPSEEFLTQLKIKFLEEAQEVYNATTKESLLEELADILEVISSLCDLYETNLDEIIRLQGKKRQERGGFQGRKFVTVAEHFPGSWGEAYCLADPQKYPEIPD